MKGHMGFWVCIAFPNQAVEVKKLFLHIDATFQGAPQGFIKS